MELEGNGTQQLTLVTACSLTVLCRSGGHACTRYLTWDAAHACTDSLSLERPLMFASSARPPGFPAAPSTGARVVAANGSKITEFVVDILTGWPSTSLALRLSPRSQRTSWPAIAPGMRSRVGADPGSVQTRWAKLQAPSTRQLPVAPARLAEQPRTTGSGWTRRWTTASDFREPTSVRRRRHSTIASSIHWL